MTKNILKAFLISILVSLLSIPICSLASSIINSSGDNSFLYMIIFLLSYISGIIAFFGCLILYNIKK